MARHSRCRIEFCESNSQSDKVISICKSNTFYAYD